MDMDTAKINSGTAAGLLEFLDYLVEKGYGSQSAISPWKSASRRVLLAMEGEGFERTSIRDLDVDEYMDRFENKERASYKSESLRAYRGRFRKAVGAYEAFLADGAIPSFRSPTSKKSGSSPTAQDGPGATPTPAEGDAGSAESSPSRRAGSPMVDYPFPLQGGGLAHLRLPATLQPGDADRLAAFVKTLVVNPHDADEAPPV